MRSAFWIACIAGLVMTAFGLISAPPLVEGVMGASLTDWYQSGIIWAAVLGALLGAGAAWATARGLRHKPGESAAVFNSRVAACGFWTICAVAGFVIIVNVVRAGGAVFVPLAPMDRIINLLGTSRFLAVVGASVLTSAAGFLAVTRVMNWGGTYALMSPAQTR